MSQHHSNGNLGKHDDQDEPGETLQHSSTSQSQHDDDHGKHDGDLGKHDGDLGKHDDDNQVEPGGRGELAPHHRRSFDRRTRCLSPEIAKIGQSITKS